MSDKKSIIEEVEDKAADVGRKVKETLDEISADEDPPKFTFPDDAKPREQGSTVSPPPRKPNA